MQVIASLVTINILLLIPIIKHLEFFGPIIVMLL